MKLRTILWIVCGVVWVLLGVAFIAVVIYNRIRNRRK